MNDLNYNITFREKDKGWQCIVSYKEKSGKWKQKSKQGFKTKREAKAYSNVIIKDLEKRQGLNKDMEGITLKEFINLFIKHISLYKEKYTINTYTYALSKLDSLYDKEMTKISTLDLQKVFDDLVKQNIKISSIKMIKTRLNYFFNTIELVKRIRIQYWFDADIYDLLSSLENGALGFEKSTTPNAYLKDMDGREIVCKVYPEYNIVDLYVNPYGFEEFEEYIFYDSLNELLDYHRSIYNDENYESVYLDSSGDTYVLLVDPNNENDQEIFERLYVYFDGDNITQIYAVAKPSITKADFEQWAEINYPYKYKFPDDDVNSYFWRQDWWNMNPVFRFNYIRFTGGTDAGKAGIRYKKEFY